MTSSFPSVLRSPPSPTSTDPRTQLIDFSGFLDGSPALKKQTALQLLSGFQTAGFVYLRNFGIPAAAIAQAFALSAGFFQRPQSEKDAMEWDRPESNRGYSGMGREKTTQLTDKHAVDALRAAVPDIKESLEIGRDGVAGMPNPWPDYDEPGRAFKQGMLHFFETCKSLHMEVMRAVALGLGIEETWFDAFTDGGDNTLRLLHYPATPKSVFRSNKEQVRAGSHSDYGSITLLFQDMRGGLQVRSPRGTFVNATPIEGTVVINAGDLLARWSNDTIKSTVHRVVEPPSPEAGDEHPARYSIAYFCNPNFEKTIEAIPNTIAEGERPKYQSVNSGQYLTARLAATY